MARPAPWGVRSFWRLRAMVYPSRAWWPSAVLSPLVKRHTGVHQPITVVGEQHVDVAELDVAILATPTSAAEGLRASLIGRGCVRDRPLLQARGERSLPLVWPTFDLDALETHPGGVALPAGSPVLWHRSLRVLQTLGELSDLDVCVMTGAQAAGRRGEEALSAQTLALLNQRIPMYSEESWPLTSCLVPLGRLGRGSACLGCPKELHRLLPALTTTPLSTVLSEVPVFAGMGLMLRVAFEGQGPSREALDEALRAEGRSAPDPR